MREPPRDATSAVVWLVDLDVAATVCLPTGTAVSRDGFLDWLWAAAAGLVGIDEGAIDVDAAATLGLVPSPLVIDAAAAPADRDWIGRLETARIACAFAGEAAAQDAARWLADLPGCRVASVRAAAGGDPAWRDAFGPVAVAGFGRVLPAWEPGAAAAGPAGATIFIEPGVGFGTGLHETTQLCLAALAAWRHGGRPIERVLDFGSGSGIVAIAAAVLGAREVDAVEIDVHVHGAIRANAGRNAVADRIRVSAGLSATAAGYDVVVANIVAPVLLEHAAALCRAVRCDAAGTPAGCLVLSGLRGADVDLVAERYAARLRTAPLHATRGEWHCLQYGGPGR